MIKKTSQEYVQERLWTASFILIIAVNFFTYVGNFMLLSTLPLLMLHIGGSKVAAGLVTGIYSLTGFVSRLQIGTLLDRRGKVPIMFAGLSLLLLIIMSYNALAYSVALLLLLRAVHGIGWSTVTTSTNTIASDLIPATRRNEGMGFFGISISLAMVIGPGLGLFIVEHYSYTLLFLLSACFIVLALATEWGKKYCCQNQISMVESVTEKTPAPAAQKKIAVIEQTALWPSFLFFIIVTTYSTIMIFLPPYASERGITNIGTFFIVIALVMMFTRLTTGRIADRYGATKVLVPGMFLLAIALQILFFSSSLPLFLLAAVFYGLGYGIVQPVLNALVVSRAPVDRRGAANATFLCAMDLGGILGAVVWGIVAQLVGFSYIYIASSILIVLAVILYLATVKKLLNLM
ncbi:MFS transporter [Sporomusa acidovorans]|uniref:Staphylopine export protein n=1 Tax=Sporomusa acidovorans (strain ATCC 49682 / DSM 3132 / Mol) TaxID=1123286 RepID=A0ABZ3J5P3_SPOA4|nr:MFS transporter [Sporomusa acidovorans]OZC18252.1 inner membrane transport protein YajR [Sporomusa acidovorans DSM 3132]SDF25928.1 Predicted arabinose efflux permease, MFS family [Sporomusa acidovorans]